MFYKIFIFSLVGVVSLALGFCLAPVAFWLFESGFYWSGWLSILAAVSLLGCFLTFVDFLLTVEAI